MKYEDLIKALKAERKEIEADYKAKRENERKAKIKAILEVRKEMLEVLKTTEKIGLWRIDSYINEEPRLKRNLYTSYAHEVIIALGFKEGDEELGIRYRTCTFDNWTEEFLEEKDANEVNEIYTYLLETVKPWFYDEVDKYLKKYSKKTEEMKNYLE